MAQSQSISPHLIERLRSMPKAEIHVHIEGATDAETFYQIAQRNHVQLPTASLEEWKAFFEFRSFPHFIEVYCMLLLFNACRLPMTTP